MLTIKVIRDGNEFVKGGIKSVAYSPSIVDGKNVPPTLTAFYADEDPETWLYGRAYVMNENGKTIAVYDIYPFPEMETKVVVE